MYKIIRMPKPRNFNILNALETSPELAGTLVYYACTENPKNVLHIVKAAIGAYPHLSPEIAFGATLFCIEATSLGLKKAPSHLIIFDIATNFESTKTYLCKITEAVAKAKREALRNRL